MTSDLMDLLQMIKAKKGLVFESEGVAYQLTDPFWPFARRITDWLVGAEVLTAIDSTEVPCTRPYCLAAKGEPCKSSDGTARGPHLERGGMLVLAQWLHTQQLVSGGGQGRMALPPTLDTL